MVVTRATRMAGHRVGAGAAGKFRNGNQCLARPAERENLAVGTGLFWRASCDLWHNAVAAERDSEPGRAGIFLHWDGGCGSLFSDGGGDGAGGKALRSLRRTAVAYCAARVGRGGGADSGGL